MITKEQLAGILNGREYNNEIFETEEQVAKENNLVVVFGASDDLIEFRGVIYNEISAWRGITIPLDKKGLVLNECDFSECPYFKRKLEEVKNTIEAVWDSAGYSWVIKTEIPHSTFEIMEDGEKFCRGIVFSMDDLK